MRGLGQVVAKSRIHCENTKPNFQEYLHSNEYPKETSTPLSTSSHKFTEQERFTINQEYKQSTS